MWLKTRMLLFAKIFKRPKKLYKYMSAEGAKDFFENPAIWFRIHNQLNDIFDINPVGSYPPDFGGVAVFCLSESPTSVPMWAHYGSQGKGVVLEFSLTAEFFRKYPALKVCYRSKRPTIKSFEKALLTKDIVWSNEREWRCLTDANFDEYREQLFLRKHEAVSVPFPYDALTAVIQGYDSRVEVDAFLARPEASHVQRLVIRPDSWRYNLKVCSLDNIDHLFDKRDAFDWGRRQRAE